MTSEKKTAGEIMGNCYERLIRYDVADPSKLLPDLAPDLAGTYDVVSLHLQPLVEPATRTGFKQRLQSAYAVFMVYFLELPYFISWSVQSRDRASQQQLRRHFLGDDAAAPKLAVFTDAFAQVDGVSLSIRRLAQTAAERGVELEIITSTPEASGPQNGARNFRATAWRPLAANPAYGFTVPPIVEILDHLEEHAFTALHASTASGMGLLALLAAKLLHLPITGTFHTDLARYAERLCPGSLVQRNTWRYTMWFYGMLDQVLVPSRTSARELVARGLDPGRVRVLPRWVDDELFAPEHRDESLRARYCRDGEPFLVAGAGIVILPGNAATERPARNASTTSGT